MIKKVLLSLGLFGLSLISFGYCNQTFLLNYPATLNDGIGTNDFELLDNANFLMNDTYKVFQIKGTALYPRLNTIFWSNTGLYVITSCEGGYDCQNIHTSIKMQGFIQKYCETNYLDSQYGCSSSCSECNNIENFIDNDIYSNPDSFSIYGVWSQNGTFCFDYENLNKSICFTIDDFNYTSHSQAINSLGFTYNPYINELTGGNLLMNYITESPFNGGGSSDIPISGTGQYVELTGNLVYSDEKCTYGELINYLQLAGYNKYLCYGGLDTFDTFDSTLNYSPVPGTGKTLGQILANASSTWDTPFEWFSFWNGLYQDRDNYISIWESYPAVYRTWFDLYYQYGGPDLIFESVNEYCTMISLVSDYTDFYNGTYFRNACQNFIIPNRYKTGDNAVSLNWGGIFGSGGSSELQNGKSFISEFFTEIKNNITIPDKSDFGLGILPSYIIWALLGLILFRFLSH